MNVYRVELHRFALKDLDKLKGAGLAGKAKGLLEAMKENPYVNPPPYEKLSGDLTGFYSRRINIQHRLVYAVNEDERVIRVMRMWLHYE